MSQSNGKVSILLVDDRPEKLLALEAVLSDLDVDMVKASSGKEALRCVLSQEFAVILLDVNMPGLDGFETASLIRQRKSSEHIPIIFITAFSDEMHVARGYSLGAVDYILAPIVPEVLRTKISVFVDLYRTTEQVKRQAEWLRRRAAQLYKLTGASLRINSALSLDKTLEIVTESAREVIGANHCCSVLALEQNWGRARHVQSLSERFEGREQEFSPAVFADLHALVAKMNRAVRMSPRELQTHPSWLAQPGSSAPQGLSGFLAAPLVSRDGRNIGLIQLSDKIDSEFNEDDEAILIQLAQMASIAIENTIFAEAREANRMKDEFLATLSHELRTPLNAMLGWTRLLRMGKLDAADTAHGLEVIERNVSAQAKLIEDLLDVSRIMTGKMRLNIRPMSLKLVIEAAIDAVRPAADAKEIQTTTSFDAEADHMSGDADRMQQVVWNLLTNAIKFTNRSGKVEVALTRQSGYVQIKVIDNGIGINPEFLPYVFDRFRQADSSSTRHHSGLGIGLAIVRHVAELHGGTVHVESFGQGHGATFTVSLPVSAVKLEAEQPPPQRRTLKSAPTVAPAAAMLAGLHILLVDDEADAREMLTEVLRRHQARVTAVGSARDALVELDRALPDVLISDIAMPDDDGYSLIRKVRGRTAEQGGQVPAMALTAYAREEDRTRALAAGYQVHVPKPVEPNELATVVAALAGRNGKPLEPVLKYG
ncbi:MAG TPA: response regulator [Tepidisphaeraceae bacterium]|jgi:signal transduction histidine kinase/DNA-binding response OmpR family regulator|nr:response regulator [Tepidisphaeraceae bacterium]